MNFDELLSKGKDLANKAKDKATDAAETVKLKTKIATNKGDMNKIFAEIGKAYYEAHKAEEADVFEESMRKIASLEAENAECEAKLAELKENND